MLLQSKFVEESRVADYFLDGTALVFLWCDLAHQSTA